MSRIGAAIVAICCLAALISASEDRHSGQIFRLASGVSIYYEVIGNAPGVPLVVANGGPGFDHTYLHLSDAWDTLASTRRVVLYDQRGNGHSSHLEPGQSCTLRDQIEDLDELRAHIGAERIDLLGHSWGGFLVMTYAARYPQHIRHLLIVDSVAPKFSDTRFLFNDVFPEGVEREDGDEFARQMGDPAAFERSLREYFSMLFYSPEKREAALAQMKDAHQNREISHLITVDIARFDLNPELPKYRFPTMVMTGRFDFNVAPMIAYKIHQAIPNSEFVAFEQSGHLPFYEEPEKFVQAVERFLAK